VNHSLIDAFGLPGTGVISIVGAGGKTTLMFRLARDKISDVLMGSLNNEKIGVEHLFSQAYRQNQ
jgi:hypothetical protein